MLAFKSSLLFLTLSLTGLFSNATTFVQDCHIVGDEDVLKMELIFSDNTLTDQLIWRATAFEDENCKTPYLIFDRKFQIISQTPAEITLRSLESSYTPISNEVARALNEINYCDINTWHAGKKQNVTGRTCQDFVQLRKNQQMTYSQENLAPSAESVTWDKDPERYHQAQ